MKNWKYVVVRHNKFGLRVPIPTELKSILGNGPITRSLGTGDPEKGKRAYHEVLGKIQGDFEAAKSTLRNSEPTALTAEMAQALVRDYYRDILFEREQHAHATLNAVGVPEHVRQEDREELTASLNLDLQMWHAEGPDGAVQIADRILVASNFPTKAVEAAHRPRGRRKRLVKALLTWTGPQMATGRFYGRATRQMWKSKSGYWR